MYPLARFSDRTEGLNHPPASAYFSIDDSMIGESLMNYEKIYSDFISDRSAKPEPSCYTEKHHIIPRSMDGSDGDNNLIRLTAGDHYFAHLCLAKIHGDKQWCGVWAMSGLHRNDRNDSVYSQRKMVEVSRVRMSEYMSRIKKGKTSNRKGIKHTAESNAKNSASCMGRVPPNKGVSPSAATRAKISAALKGRIIPEAYRKNMAKALIGRPVSAETRKKMSISAKARFAGVKK